MTRILLTTDDLAPSNIKGQFEFWDRLWKKHKNFQLLAFTTANWNFRLPKESKFRGNNSILRKDFIEFCNERKNWLLIAYHGLTHEIAESNQPYEDQQRRMKEMLSIFDKFGKKFKGKIISAYKPPFYRFNSDALYTCRDLGIKYFFMQDGILDLQTYNFFRRNDIHLIDSHTNLRAQSVKDGKTHPIPDRIDFLYERLDKFLSNQNAWQNFIR